MILGLAAALVAAGVLWLTGGTGWAGAHPFWSDSVIWIGTPIGMVLFALSTRLRGWPVVLGSVLLTAVALFAAARGKAIFAASFAENATAGQVWYIGWIATCAGLALTVAHLALWLQRR